MVNLCGLLMQINYLLVCCLFAHINVSNNVSHYCLDQTENYLSESDERKLVTSRLKIYIRAVHFTNRVNQISPFNLILFFLQSQGSSRVRNRGEVPAHASMAIVYLGPLNLSLMQVLGLQVLYATPIDALCHTKGQFGAHRGGFLQVLQLIDNNHLC